MLNTSCNLSATKRILIVIMHFFNLVILSQSQNLISENDCQSNFTRRFAVLSVVSCHENNSCLFVGSHVTVANTKLNWTTGTPLQTEIS